MRATGSFRTRGRSLRLCAAEAVCAGLVLAACAPGAAWAKGSGDTATPAAAPSGVPIRVPLAPLGFQPLLQEFLLAGATGLTADFVDNDHVLVTFNKRVLMKRDPDEQPGDDDCTVDAVLLELPSGKLLARTEWRLHDRLQYLWNLGHGRFLLRVRDSLSLLAPVDRLASGDAFRGTPVLEMGDRHIAAVLVSSGHDLLTLETTRGMKRAAGVASDVSFAGADDGGPVQINFYRLNDGPEGFSAEPAGIVRAPAPMAVPMTRAGILDVLPGGKNRWLFNFNEHAGKVDELAEWDTACRPLPQFVGPGEFIAFGCRGSEDKPEIAAFNLNGEEMWEQGLYESYIAPQFDCAPAAGRFAFERLILDASLGDDASVPADAVAGEEVRVYQAETGRILLKVYTSPAERAGGNYALSPDGMRLAVFEQASRQRTTQLGGPYTESATSLVVYPLPALSGEEGAKIQQMAAKAPEDTGARIDVALARMASEDTSRAVDDRSDTKAVEGQNSASRLADAVLGPPKLTGATAAAAAAGAGDDEPGNPAMLGELPNAPEAGSQGSSDPVPDAAAPGGPRKPPTLYQPGESASTSAPKKSP